MTKKVLIITYYFPPRPGVASLRLKGLAKYLPEFGWEPVILTVPMDKEGSRNLLGFPSGFNEKVKIIETPYQGDIFWFWGRYLRN